MDQKMLFSQYNNVCKISMASKEIVKKDEQQLSEKHKSCVLKLHCSYDMISSISLSYSPEYRWILFYKPVDVKAVVKLDGGRKN